MTDKLESTIRMVEASLFGKLHIDEDDIEYSINTFIIPLTMEGGPFEGLDVDVLKQILINKYECTSDSTKILDAKERRVPWLREYRANGNCTWGFWNDYKKYLSLEKNYNQSVIDELDELTDRILDRLFNPNREGVHLHKKGLVVGQVQSGKTSNYTGLICKAADSGFDLIIVLAGVLNNLRSQTQMRLDEGFLGFDTQYERAYIRNSSSNMGVGMPSISMRHPVAHSYTTSKENGDFKKRIAEGLALNFHTKEPVIFVVKKNKSVLTNLDNWIVSKIAPDEVCNYKSVLIIDDEADHASINTKKSGDPTAINKCIKNLMKRFHKVAYVGYTATPFANIFIPFNDEDLFPRDFIINLVSPPNYIGPKRVFGFSEDINDDECVQVLPIVTTICDYEGFVPTKHKKNDPLPIYDDMPESLKKAVMCFILTCAIRMARNQEHQHSSMLIHISRFQIWQAEIKYLIDKLHRFYLRELEYGSTKMLEEFRKLFEETTDDYVCYKDVTLQVLESDFAKYDPEVKVHKWEEIKPFLKKAASKIEVKALNGSSADVLSYYEHKKNGLYTIVIGGDKLSRGLTLEGLSVSYFLRASKMYDTLMQMGRWFGYRPGYSDLCRLFTSGELNEWFQHITTASEELRKEFDQLWEIMGTPDEYSLKVRSHPGVLQVTASNKMYYSKGIQLSWSARLIEAYAIPNDKQVRLNNLIATCHFVQSLGAKFERPKKNYLWREVNPEEVLDFLKKFTVAKSLRSVDIELLTDYIKHLNLDGELLEWNVALINKSVNPTAIYKYPNGIEIGCQRRTRSRYTDYDVYCLPNSRVINPMDEFVDLSAEEFEKAMQLTKDIKAENGESWELPYPQGSIFRENMRNMNKPLLIIYTLDPYYANRLNAYGKIDENNIEMRHDDTPFVNFAISFPRTRTNYTVQYVSNLIEDFAYTDNLFEEENDNTYEE